YSIKRVRQDEMDLPEHRQATYLMPSAPEIAEPGSAQDKKPQSEAPAVAALLPATAAPGGAPPAALATARGQTDATPRGQTDATARVGFWARFKRLLAGESAAAEPPPASAASPVRAPRRDGGPRRDGRGEHPRHSRYAEGSRRDREGRRGDGRDRDRNRDGRDRDRNRDPGRRPERFAERGGERGADRGASNRGEPGQQPMDASARPDPGAAVPSPAPPVEVHAD